MRHALSRTAALLILLANPALAGWSVDGLLLGPRASVHYGGFVRIVPDGAGGALALTDPWHRASRVDSNGEVLWSVNPFAAFGMLDPALNRPNPRVIEADGSGGLWMACWDTSKNVVALHFDENGVRQGEASILCENLPGVRYPQTAVRDARGGFFVLWQDERAYGEFDILASHVDASGSVTGPANGLVVFGGAGNQVLTGAAPDGQGGLLVVEHKALGATVQRFDVDLEPKYGTGVHIDAPEVIGPFSIAATGDGGAFVAWPESSGESARVRVQRLDANGRVTPGWPAEGTLVGATHGTPSTVHVIADGTGGASVAWLNQYGLWSPNEPDPTFDVRGSRVLANGRVAQGWAPSGVVAGSAYWPSIESRSILVADGAGGFYIAWADVGFYKRAMYAQHLAPDGTIFPGWPAGGLKVGGLMGSCKTPSAISDGAGGVYVGWDEYTFRDEHQARVIRLSPGGLSGEPVLSSQPLSLARIAPNPARGLFTVNTTLPDDRPARLEVFDLAGRVSYAREVQGAGEQGLTLDSAVLPTGMHWMRLTHPTGVRMARIVVVH